MIKKLLPLSTILILFAAVVATAQPKIGYMDTQKVMNNLPQRQSVQQKIRSFAQQKQQQLAQRATKYQKALTQFQKNKSSMSQQQLSQQKKQLTNMKTSLSQYQQQLRQQIQQRRDSLLSPILKNINDAIAAIAKKNNLDFILNKSSQSGQNVIFYASDDQTDITQQVINRLTSNSQK